MTFKVLSGSFGLHQEVKPAGIKRTVFVVTNRSKGLYLTNRHIPRQDHWAEYLVCPALPPAEHVRQEKHLDGSISLAHTPENQLAMITDVSQRLHSENPFVAEGVNLFDVHHVGVPIVNIGNVQALD